MKYYLPLFFLAACSSGHQKTNNDSFDQHGDCGIQVNMPVDIMVYETPELNAGLPGNCSGHLEGHGELEVRVIARNSMRMSTIGWKDPNGVKWFHSGMWRPENEGASYDGVYIIGIKLKAKPQMLNSGDSILVEPYMMFGFGDIHGQDGPKPLTERFYHIQGGSLMLKWWHPGSKGFIPEEGIVVSRLEIPRQTHDALPIYIQFVCLGPNKEEVSSDVHQLIRTMK